MIGAWGRKHKPFENPEKMPIFLDAEQGTEIKPIVIDQVTGAEIGTQAIHQQAE